MLFPLLYHVIIYTFRKVNVLQYTSLIRIYLQIVLFYIPFNERTFQQCILNFPHAFSYFCHVFYIHINYKYTIHCYYLDLDSHCSFSTIRKQKK